MELKRYLHSQVEKHSSTDWYFFTIAAYGVIHSPRKNRTNFCIHVTPENTLHLRESLIPVVGPLVPLELRAFATFARVARDNKRVPRLRL